MSTRLAELKAAGQRAANIEHALKQLKQAERTLSLVNRYAKENAGKAWKPKLRLDKGGNHYSDPVKIDVAVPHEFVQRQAINAVIDARRRVVMAGGELPTATEQVQRGGR